MPNNTTTESPLTSSAREYVEKLEKEFDRLAEYDEPYLGIGCCGGDYCEHKDDSGSHNTAHNNAIKSFLTSTLTSLLSCVPEEFDLTVDFTHPKITEMIGFNEAIYRFTTNLARLVNGEDLTKK